MRYAQEYGGQKLHLVYEPGDDRNHWVDSGQVSVHALCGRAPHKQGRWGMTINMPLGHACGNCVRVYGARYGKG